MKQAERKLQIKTGDVWLRKYRTPYPTSARVGATFKRPEPPRASMAGQRAIFQGRVLIHRSFGGARVPNKH